MSTVNSASIATIGRGFEENYILSALYKMKLGTLEVILPGGESIIFGNGEGNITASIRINKNSFFKRVLLYGDIGFGEAYTAGDWDTENITNVIKWMLLNIDNAPSISGSKIKSLGLNFLKFANKLKQIKKENNVSGSKKNIEAHYDLNNDFFSLFLDPSMTYSAAYFNNNNITLQQAQEAKYDRLCKQLNLQPTDHVLEIGSGWGANAIYMAKNYGCKVTTTTISQEQYIFAKEKIEAAGLSGKVEILLQDYRKLSGNYDKIVSIEMLEAVGNKYLPIYFKKCNQLLRRNGILALQVITCPDSRYNSLRKGVDWIQKHIFPGSLLPSVGIINKMVNRTSELTLLDLKDFGLDYAKTLHLWREAFNLKLPAIRGLGFDEAFIRKWNYYFSYCEAGFAMRNIHVMQLVYARPNTVLK